MNTKIAEIYRELIDKKKWIPWEEYITLKVGDTITVNEYDSNDKLIGTSKIWISELRTEIDSIDPKIEMGHVTGMMYKYDLSYNQVATMGMSGMISANVDNIKDSENSIYVIIDASCEFENGESVNNIVFISTSLEEAEKQWDKYYAEYSTKYSSTWYYSAYLAEYPNGYSIHESSNMKIIKNTSNFELENKPKTNE